jgi:uncharacterized protein (DUF1501 family)
MCDGTTRRDTLKLGSMSLMGLGLGLPQLLRLQAQAADTGKPARGISCILIWLQGGSSTMDMWDLKPDAPAEFRGPFKEIATNVPGTRISEHLPKCARQMDKLTLVRSFTHTDAGHGPADHWMMTGYKPGPGFMDADGMVNNQRPAYGAVVAKELGPQGALPAYVTVPSLPKSGGAAYLGPSAAPFVIASDPSAPDFSVRDLQLAHSVDANRLENRRSLIRSLDRFQNDAEAKAAVESNSRASATSTYYRKAFELVTSPQAKEAFDIAKENPKLRDEYGRNSLGQSCLMARRLVEAGVRFVTVEHGNWDTHTKNFESLATNLLPTLDAAIATLLRDLADRGLLESTLVIATGEFARTPRINGNAGRDHWPNGMTIPIAGGGVKGGIVLGASDARAEKPATDPVGPADLAATIYHLMGIDYSKTYHGPLGRPLPILDYGKPIDGIL